MMNTLQRITHLSLLGLIAFTMAACGGGGGGSSDDGSSSSSSDSSEGSAVPEVPADTPNLDVRGTLGSIETLVSGLNNPIMALDVDMNASGDAVVSWMDFNSATNNLSTSTSSAGSSAWSAATTVGSNAGAETFDQRVSVFLDDSLATSLFYVKDVNVGGGAWTSQLIEQVVGGAATNLSAATATTGEATKLAYRVLELGSERLKMLAVDNNDQAEPICIFLQQTDSPSSQRFCIPASAEIQADGGTVDDIALAVHVNADGLTGRGLVVWEQEGAFGTRSVVRLHGALFDLDVTNIVTKVLAGESGTGDTYAFTAPVLENISTDSNIVFALSYERDEIVSSSRVQQMRLETVSNSLAQTSVASVSSGVVSNIDVVRAPQLTLMAGKDLRWSYITENYLVSMDSSSLFIGSGLVTWRLRYQDNQSPLYSLSVDDAHFFGGSSGSLITHYAQDVDAQGDSLLAFRESARSAGTDARSLVSGVVLNQEIIRGLGISAAGDAYSLTDSSAEIDKQLYDDDPNNGSDTRAPLAFTKDDAVLDIALSDNGEAVIAWSQWQQADDRNALKTVRLALP